MGYKEVADLYERHREGLVRTAARLLADRAAAEDVVQETYVRALQFGGEQPAGASDVSGAEGACAIRGLPEKGLPSPAWLYRVTLNLCYDHLRALRRSGSLGQAPGRAWSGAPASGDWGEEESAAVPADAAPATETSEPENVALRREIAAAVRTAVAGLPPALREVVILREYGGLKYREIAETILCPIGTVMSRLHLARRRLRRSLAPYLELELGSLPEHGAGSRDAPRAERAFLPVETGRGGEER